ncbi:MAG: queuosine precursor transporter [Chloroherpetonaceae bacterium]
MTTNALTIEEKRARLFLILGMFFITNALLGEFAGTKVFSLEATLGLSPMDLSLFGVEHLSFNLTAGVIAWPLVFVLTDVVNEYFGRRGVRLISFIAAGLIAYAFLIIYATIRLSPADFWQFRVQDGERLNMNLAYNAIFGQGLWIIVGSLIAFLVGQFLDVTVFEFFKAKTGGEKIWLRATGSTLVSQLIDSFIVLFIAFYIGAGWSLSQVLAVCTMNYLYKAVVAVFSTPLVYLAHFAIDRYLDAPSESALDSAPDDAIAPDVTPEKLN